LWCAAMKVFRIVVTATAIVIVQTIICGIAILPAVLLWRGGVRSAPPDSPLEIVVASMFLMPAYIVFALGLMPVSAIFMRIVGARTPPRAALRISDMSWPLMKWVQYMSASHIVRLVSGTMFRGSPLWTAYLRMNGARIGKRVFINTLSIADHNLLELGDDVVIGADVHISGHTVEDGMLKTAGVRVGSHVTIGLGSAIDIDVDIGNGCQIGALTFVPKHTRLDPNGVYVGIPARKLGERATDTLGPVAAS
jgi:acetyltransferase-like isoleucine patch superfamily enzyme